MTPPVATGERRPVPAIDPRIRARRIAVQRDVGRRRLHWLSVLGGLVAIVAVTVVAALSPLLDVDAVEVTGALRAEVAAVIAASGVERGDPLVVLDSAGATAAIRRLPWVDEVTIARVWPGTVAIDLVERVPVAGFLEAGSRVALVDRTGRILDVVSAEGSGVVLVSGLAPPGAPGGDIPSAGEPALAVAAALPAEVAPHVAQLVVGDAGQLRLTLRLPATGPPAEVILGDDSLLAAKVAALSTLLATVDLTDLDTLDLEVPSTPALTRR